MDYSQYTADWRDTIRPAILKRDQYKCSVCGVHHRSRVYKLAKGQFREVDQFEEEFVKAQGRKVFTLYLQVAHLDHNKLNNDPANLRALCPYHHAKHDAEHKRFSRLIYRGKMNAAAAPAAKIKPEFNFFEFKSFVHELTGFKIPVDQLKSIFDYVNNQQ